MRRLMTQREALTVFVGRVLCKRTLDDDGVLLHRYELSPVEHGVVHGQHIRIIEYRQPQVHPVVGKILVLEIESH
ncbi:hypothetical protein SDC9_192403 [bioreactor metagenome]|uniref:Uncharacterized protein n=1 Tax=bioreactor metagenome TaxID=1076179 RepID=A0A645I1V8_9ZZZZ